MIKQSLRQLHWFSDIKHHLLQLLRWNAAYTSEFATYFIWFFSSPSRTYSLFNLWAFTLTCSIIWQAWIRTLKQFSFRQPTKELRWYQENFLCWNAARMRIFCWLFESIIFQFHQPPISFHVNLTFPHFEKIVQFSLPKVQPATEQSILLDVFRGVASIAFCL